MSSTSRPESRYDKRPQSRYEPRFEPRDATTAPATTTTHAAQRSAVVDYRPYHLAPPPRGQQWVQVGADYVWIAIATGLIANIVLSR